MRAPLCVAVVNSRIAVNTTPMLAVISLLGLIGTLSSMIEDEDRERIAAAMCDIAERIGRTKPLLLEVL